MEKTKKIITYIALNYWLLFLVGIVIAISKVTS